MLNYGVISSGSAQVMQSDLIDVTFCVHLIHAVSANSSALKTCKVN